MSASSAPIEVFYSYADADEVLNKHLKLLQRDGPLTPWHRLCISAGMNMAETIDQHINAADHQLRLYDVRLFDCLYWLVHFQRMTYHTYYKRLL